MKKVKYISALMLLMALFASCNDFLEPEDNNSLTSEIVYKDPAMAEGVLLNAYNALPNTYADYESATDIAVTNISDANRLAATGSLTASNYPFDNYTINYQSIQYVNLFLKNMPNVTWSKLNPFTNKEFPKKLKGEAHGLRAYYQIRLLLEHSGPDAAGNLWGYAIVNSFTEGSVDRSKGARNTYKECYDAIINDLDTAIKYLPSYYVDVVSSDSNLVYGAKFNGRMTSVHAKLLKARVMLHAASPAFSKANAATYKDAADFMVSVIKDLKAGDASRKAAPLVLAPNRVTFWLQTGANTYSSDIAWRRNVGTGSAIESSNYPPSLGGSGRLNPTQNFVNLFPDNQGYPISQSTIFDAQKPFDKRDPRLAKYVVYNGSVLKGATINTIDNVNDGVNRIIGRSTASGYYLRKLLNENVNILPTVTAQTRFHTMLRYTELYLSCAEALNEAYGYNTPSGNGPASITAKTIMTELRTTAGIITDTYLNTVVTNDNLMRELIRNERIIDLSFEQDRFWSMRRLNLVADMQKPALGTLDGGKTSFEVEPRAYKDYMIYMPVPEDEYRKGLTQNLGWE